MHLRLLISALIVSFLCSCSEPSLPETEKDIDSPTSQEPASSEAAAEPGASSQITTPEGMVLIPGGPFQQGGDAEEMGGNSVSHQTSYPIHEVQVDAFWIDETEVTNRQFKEFADATGYVTFAERPLPAERIAELEQGQRENLAWLEEIAQKETGRKKEEILAAAERVRNASVSDLRAGSIIFATPIGEVYDPNDISQWWQLVPDATWRTPGGLGTTLEGLEDHPVVNLTHEDAATYAEWAGKRLPTEAEWEKAARGGLEHEPYTWGSEMFPQGEGVWMANIWQGKWPQKNTEEDGYFTTSPVKSFPPNGYGLYDMSGNVWEMVMDLYSPDAYKMPSATIPNTTGPPPEAVLRPGDELIPRVTKGGSFLCSDVWCKGYQPGSREQVDNESPANHTGFRCAMTAQ